MHHIDIAGLKGTSAAQTLIDGALPRHALKMHTQLVPVSLRSALPHNLTLDMSEYPNYSGSGEEIGLSRLNGSAVVCLAGVGSPEVSFFCIVKFAIIFQSHLPNMNISGTQYAI